MPDWVKAQHDCVLAAVTRDGTELEHASEALRDNTAIATAAVRSSPAAFACIGPVLREDCVFALATVEGHLAHLHVFSDTVRHDAAVFLTALTECPEDAVLRLSAADLPAQGLAFSHAMVQANGAALSLCTQHADDREVALDAVCGGFRNIRFVSQRLRCDRGFVVSALDVLEAEARKVGRRYYEDSAEDVLRGLNELGESLQADRTFVMLLLRRSGALYRRCLRWCFEDVDVALQAVSTSWGEMAHIPTHFLRNEAFMLPCIARDGCTIQHLDPAAPFYMTAVALALQQNKHAVFLLPPHVQRLPEVLLCVLDTEDKQERHTTPNIRTNTLLHPLALWTEPDLIAEALRRSSGTAFAFLSKDVRQCREHAFRAVSLHGANYRVLLDDASSELLNDADIVSAAVASCGAMLEHIPEVLKTEAVTLCAVQNDGTALQHAGSHVHNEGVSAAAVAQNPLSLQFCTAGHSATYATSCLERNGLSLQFCPHSVRADRSSVLLSLKRFGDGIPTHTPIRYCSPELLLHAEFRAECIAAEGFAAVDFTFGDEEEDVLAEAFRTDTKGLSDAVPAGWRDAVLASASVATAFVENYVRHFRGQTCRHLARHATGLLLRGVAQRHRGARLRVVEERCVEGLDRDDDGEVRLVWLRAHAADQAWSNSHTLSDEEWCTVICTCPPRYRDAPPALRGDHVFASRLLARCGDALQYAPYTVRDSDTAVASAVACTASAFRHASVRLRSSEAFAQQMAALHGTAVLHHLTDALRHLTPTQPQKVNLFIFPGAFMTEAHYTRVTSILAELTAARYELNVVHVVYPRGVPGVQMRDYVEEGRRAVAGCGGGGGVHNILVAHSMGSRVALASAALLLAEGVPLAGVAHIAGTIVADGASLQELVDARPKVDRGVPAEARPHLSKDGRWLVGNKSGFVGRIFCNTCSEEDVEYTRGHMVPELAENMRFVATCPSDVLLRDLPQCYLACTEDHALALDFQKEMAATGQVHDADVFTLDSDHMPTVGVPRLVAVTLQRWIEGRVLKVGGEESEGRENAE